MGDKGFWGAALLFGTLGISSGGETMSLLGLLLMEGFLWAPGTWISCEQNRFLSLPEGSPRQGGLGNLFVAQAALVTFFLLHITL